MAWGERCKLFVTPAQLKSAQALGLNIYDCGATKLPCDKDGYPNDECGGKRMDFCCVRAKNNVVLRWQ